MNKTIILAGADLAAADTTVECHSRDFNYDECRASGLTKPQRVHQISSSARIGLGCLTDDPDN